MSPIPARTRGDCSAPENDPLGKRGTKGTFRFSKMSPPKGGRGLGALRRDRVPFLGRGQGTLSLRSVPLSPCPGKRLTVCPCGEALRKRCPQHKNGWLLKADRHVPPF